MDKKLKSMLHQLKGKTFPNSLRNDFGKYGDEAFDLLLDLAKNEESTEKEVSNALLIMLHMCGQPCANRSQELFSLGKLFLDNKSGIVRSVAVRVVVGLISISIDYPTICKLIIPDRKVIINALLHANDLGINTETESYLNQWMESYKEFASE